MFAVVDFLSFSFFFALRALVNANNLNNKKYAIHISFLRLLSRLHYNSLFSFDR